MKKTIRNLLLALLSVAGVGAAATYTLFGQDAPINFLAAFWCAAVVVAASGFGYWQMVSGSRGHHPHHDLPDIVDSLDDKYGLWEEDGPAELEDVKRLLEEERARQKRNRPKMSERVKNAKPALSLYRLAAYALLLGGLCWLIRDGRFEPVAYLIGAGAAPLTIAAILYGQLQRH